MPTGSLLPRVLEPEVMDAADEARDYDAMDHRAVNQIFATDFLHAARQLPLTAVGEVLDLGTGTAQIPIELCRRHDKLRLLAIDLSQEMLRLGHDNVARAGLSGRIVLQRVDAKELPFVAGQYAAVISNSIVHHLPDPAAALAEAARVLAPGGLIFVRDLMRPYDDAQVRWLVDTYAAEANARQRSLFDASLRAALTLAEMREVVSKLGWEPTTVAATSDRHWTWSGLKTARGR
jgi:ubiquinone/menaquinone biosynthesis C-methylase UbiE